MKDNNLLPEAILDRIEKESIKQADVINTSVTTAPDDARYVWLIAKGCYISGATDEATRSLKLIEALEIIRKILNEWTNESNTAWNVAHNALEKYNQQP